MMQCPRCRTPHHQDCWDQKGGCAVYGCEAVGAQAGKSPETPEAAPVPEPKPPARLSPAAEEEFERVVEEVARALHFGKLPQAEQGVRRLLEIAPHSTTAHELHGDVLSALRQTAAAREAYHRALEAEPANADAERKFAELALADGQKHWAAEALLAGDADRFRGAAHKAPSGAALRSMIFPGLGQLYNGDFEIGVVLAGLGLGLLMGVLGWFLAPLVFSSIPGSRVSEPGPGIWGWLSLIGYLVVYVYSIYEAYSTARSQQ